MITENGLYEVFLWSIIYFLKYLFIWLCWLFLFNYFMYFFWLLWLRCCLWAFSSYDQQGLLVVVHRLLFLVVELRLYAHSLQQLWLEVPRRARGLSSCGARAQLLCSMQNLAGLGIKPMFPALAGRFLSTAPPGKSCVGS